MKTFRDYHNYTVLECGTILNSKGDKLKSYDNGKGYRKIDLYKSGKRKSFYVHRVVWEAFNGEIPEGYEVDHKNDCRDINRLSNLQLLTRKSNMKKMFDRNPNIVYNLKQYGNK